MLASLRTVKSIFKFTLYDKAFLLALIPAITLTTFGYIIRYKVAGNNIPDLTQVALTSLTTTLYAYIIGLCIRVGYEHRKYAKLAGKYLGYAYKNEEDVSNKDFYNIEDKPQSVATLEYVGGSDYRIQVSVTYPPKIGDLIWVGDMKIISSNMATVAWWYKNKRLRYEIGHKRAVIVDEKIVLFSDDRSIHGREVFIKQR